MFEFLKRKKNTVTCNNRSINPLKPKEGNPFYYTEEQLTNELEIIKQRIIDTIGEGSFSLSFEKCETCYNIIGSLFITKNDKIYNSLFEQLFWQIRHDYPKTAFSLSFPDFIDACRPIATRHNITMKLTDWTIEHIFIDRYSIADYIKEEHGIGQGVRY